MLESRFVRLALGTVVAVLFAVTAGLAVPALAELPPLIPRDILFGNPERTSPQISPDGKKLAWLAPDKKNVLQVWVKTIGKDDDKMVTADKKRGIRQYFWTEGSKVLVYAQDLDGDENFHLYGSDLESGNVRDYTPFQGVRAGIEGTDPAFPDEMLVSMNLRDRRLMDVHRITLSTGAVKLDTENPGDVAGWGTDAKFQVRAAQVKTPDGGTEIRIRDDAKSPWKSWLKVGPAEILDFIDFTADGKSAYLESSIGRDTAAVLEKNIASGTEKVIASSLEVDAGGFLIHPKKHVIQAVAFSPGRTTWTVLDPSVKADFEGIAKLSDGDFRIYNRDDADATWLVGFTRDKGPVRFYSWDRKGQKGTFLFVHQPKLDGLALAETEGLEDAQRGDETVVQADEEDHVLEALALEVHRHELGFFVVHVAELETAHRLREVELGEHRQGLVVVFFAVPEDGRRKQALLYHGLGREGAGKLIAVDGAVVAVEHGEGIDRIELVVKSAPEHVAHPGVDAERDHGRLVALLELVVKGELLVEIGEAGRYAGDL